LERTARRLPVRPLKRADALDQVVATGRFHAASIPIAPATDKRRGGADGTHDTTPMHIDFCFRRRPAAAP
ncbi:MAG: hypothetical protein M3N47_05075, partial [Chloroflexota bacterium]|nr:hypothetical protein [Chloroflexota bacterium]